MGFDRTLLLHLATSQRLERGVKALPGGEAVAWRAASRYVAGRTEREALQTAEALLNAGHAVSVDLFGERVDDPATADQVVDRLPVAGGGDRRAADDAWLSLDLSHLAVHVDPAAAADRLETIARRSPPAVGSRSAPRTPPTPTRSSAACSRWPAAGCATGSARPSRPTCCARPPTRARSSTPASTCGWSRAPTSSGPARIRSASRPTSPTCSSVRSWPGPERTGRWPRTTAGCARAAAGRAGVGRRTAARGPHRRARGAARPRRQDPGVRALRPRLVSLLGAPRRRVSRRVSGRPAGYDDTPRD